MKKTMKQIFLITAGILLAAVNLFSQNITVKSSVDNDSLLIGTQMNFNIGINMPVNTSFQLAGPENNIDGHIEILSSKIDSSRSDDHLEVTYHYLITSFDSGHYTIPSYQVIVNNPAGPQNLYTDSLLITVYSPPVDTSASIKDIRTVINTPLTFREALPYIAGAAGILVLAVLLVLLLRRIKGKDPVKLRKVVVVPPYAKALKALDYLKKEKMWQKGQVKEYYIILSDTIRQYVEDQFGVDARESTTGETLQKFRRIAYDDSLLLEMLESLLNLSDLVKFAREDPTPTENETNLNNAYLFVEKTKPAETGLKSTEEN